MSDNTRALRNFIGDANVTLLEDIKQKRDSFMLYPSESPAIALVQEQIEKNQSAFCRSLSEKFSAVAKEGSEEDLNVTQDFVGSENIQLLEGLQQLQDKFWRNVLGSDGTQGLKDMMHSQIWEKRGDICRDISVRLGVLGQYNYEIGPRDSQLRAGWEVRLFEDAVEMGRGVYTPDAGVSGQVALDHCRDDADAHGQSWVNRHMLERPYE